MATPFLFWYYFVFLFLFYGITSALIQCWFLARFTGINPLKREYVFYCILYEILSAAGYSGILENILLSSGFWLLTIYGFLRVRFKQNPITSLTMGLLVLTIQILIAALSAPVGNLLSQMMDHPFFPYLFGLLSSIGSIVAMALIFFFLIKHFSIRLDRPNPYLLVLVTPMFFIYLFLCLVLQVGYTGPIETPLRGERFFTVFNDWQILFLVLLAFAAVCGCLLASKKTMEYFAAEQKSFQLKQQLSLQEAYTEQAKLRYDLTRSFRHDLKNHIFVLKGMIERGETKKTLAYLDDFEQVSNHLSFPAQTGNAAIDVLFSDKLALAQQDGIEVRCDVYIPDNININDFDLCIAFSNAIDNAIKACSLIQNRAKWIDIKARRNNDFFLIDIVNSYDRYADTQKGAGLGLPNIQSVAQKYNGTIKTEKTNDIFVLTVLFSLRNQK